MELSDTHKQVAYSAWAASRDGGGVAVDDPSGLVAAIELAEMGWLRRSLTEGGELGWFWTTAAETALGLSALCDTTGREN